MKHIILTAWVAVLFQALACSKAPLAMKQERRYLKSWLSGFSARVMEHTSLTTDGEDLYFGSASGTLYRADGVTGKKKWSKNLDGAIDAIPLVMDETVFVGTIKGEFYALEKSSGQVKWKYSVVGEVIGQPSVLSDMVYVGTHLGHVYALESQTGKYVWRHKKDPADRMVIHAFTKPLAQKEMIIVGFSDGTILCLQAKTGDVVWSQSWTDTEKFSDISWLTQVSDKMLMVGKFNGQAAGYQIDDGTQVWTSSNAASAAPPSLHDQKVIVAASDSTVQLIEPSTGQSLRKYEPKKPLRWSGVSVYKNFVLVSSFDGSMHVLSLNDGAFLWEYDLSYPILGPAIVIKDKAWLITKKGLLISLQP